VANPKLLIFAKHPTPGDVMTRLCPPLTPEEAADVHRACVRLLCERAFRAWPVRPTLVISPDDAEPRFREFVGPYIPILPQGDGDLGERLTRAAEAVLQNGSPPLLIMGTDSPTMPADRLAAAQVQLKEADAVLGPCRDGGFYMLGLNRVVPGMLDGVAWGTERAAAQTIERMQSRGLKVATIDPWYDIDRPDDLERAVGDMRSAHLPDDYELLRVIEDAIDEARARRSGAA